MLTLSLWANHINQHFLTDNFFMFRFGGLVGAMLIGSSPTVTAGSRDMAFISQEFVLILMKYIIEDVQ